MVASVKRGTPPYHSPLTTRHYLPAFAARLAFCNECLCEQSDSFAVIALDHSAQGTTQRHAEAQENAPGEPDEKRPLTPAGARAAKSLGMRLKYMDVKVDAIWHRLLGDVFINGAAIESQLSSP